MGVGVCSNKPISDSLEGIVYELVHYGAMHASRDERHKPTQTHTHIHTRTHTHTNTNTRARAHTQKNMYTHTRARARVHAHTEELFRQHSKGKTIMPLRLPAFSESWETPRPERAWFMQGQGQEVTTLRSTQFVPFYWTASPGNTDSRNTNKSLG